jgi:multiple sugar transport system permease protein
VKTCGVDPLLVCGRLATVGLGYFQSLYKIEWASILVGSMFNAIPILVIFFIFNKYYMQSGSMTGLAGQ